MAMAHNNEKRVAIGSTPASYLESLSRQWGVTLKEANEMMICFFYESGLDPREPIKSPVAAIAMLEKRLKESVTRAMSSEAKKDNNRLEKLLVDAEAIVQLLSEKGLREQFKPLATRVDLNEVRNENADLKKQIGDLEKKIGKVMIHLASLAPKSGERGGLMDTIRGIIGS